MIETDNININIFSLYILLCSYVVLFDSLQAKKNIVRFLRSWTFSLCFKKNLRKKYSIVNILDTYLLYKLEKYAKIIYKQFTYKLGGQGQSKVRFVWKQLLDRRALSIMWPLSSTLLAWEFIAHLSSCLSPEARRKEVVFIFSSRKM